MTAGRPRTVSLPPNEMIKLGIEMVDWVILNKPLHLSEWYTIEKLFTYKQWETFVRMPEFLPYYEKALKLIGKNYLDGTVNPSIAQRWQRVYFDDIRKREDDDLQLKLDKELEQKRKLLEIDAELKSKANANTPPNDSIIDMQNENMLLKAKLAKYESPQVNIDNKS